MTARWVLTWKGGEGDGPPVAKARLVLRGFQDDLCCLVHVHGAFGRLILPECFHQPVSSRVRLFSEIAPPTSTNDIIHHQLIVIVLRMGTSSGADSGSVPAPSDGPIGLARLASRPTEVPPSLTRDGLRFFCSNWTVRQKSHEGAGRRAGRRLNWSSGPVEQLVHGLLPPDLP